MVGGSMTDGSHIGMVRSILDMYTGEIKIQHKGYFDDPSYDNLIETDYNELMHKIEKSFPDIGIAPRLRFDGLISNRDSLGASIIAIDPIKEKKVSKVYKNIEKGTFLSGEGNEIIIGKEMAKLLNLNLNDKLVILSQGSMGSMAVDLFKVVGIFDLHQPEANTYMAFTNLKAAQSFLMIDGISSLTLKTDVEQVDKINKRISEILPEGLVSLPWWKLTPDLKQLIDLDSAFGILFFIILMVIIAVGVMETIVLSIHERVREIGILLAVGMKSSSIMLLFFLEGLIMVFVGSFIGGGIGYPIILYYYNHPIYLSSAQELYEYFGAEPYMYFALHSPFMWQLPLSLLILFFIFIIIPI